MSDRFTVFIEQGNEVCFVDAKDKKQLLSFCFKERSDAEACKQGLSYQCDLMNELDKENVVLRMANQEMEGYIKVLEKEIRDLRRVKNIMPTPVYGHYEVINKEGERNE